MLDDIPGIIGYALVKAEDGSIEEVQGSSTLPLGDLVAYFSSASEVIVSNLSLGNINYLSLCYGAHRLVILPYASKYLGVETERKNDPLEFIDKVIFDAGGRRPYESEKNQNEELNADYILGSFVFELKSLMEEGLEKESRRQKISNLFNNYYSDNESIIINPEILTQEDILEI